MATGYIMLDTKRPDPQQGMYPRRGGHKPSGTCIVHTTEGNWQAGAASLVGLVLRRADYGCYHRACDWADIELLYPWEWETWQDSETNNWAVGIAACCKTSDWGKMPQDVEEGFYRNMAKMAADFVSYMKKVHGIEVPLRRISGAEARARKPGFCAHGDSGIARSDPGANFNWSRFFEYTKQELGQTQGGFLMALSDAQQQALYRQLCTPEGRAELADAILTRDFAWYGFDGKQPAEGRRTTSIATDLGWSDTARSHVARQLNELLERPVAEVNLSEPEIESLAEQLKSALAPELAKELGKRLASE